MSSLVCKKIFAFRVNGNIAENEKFKERFAIVGLIAFASLLSAFL